ncbi:hypothetical protein A9W99_08250 [Mycobacterium sp. 1164966.3]|uniref:Rv2629 family ribosome hibernation factor n=1 Tax=Mycobacterium sp. 1164966.3 TaxID=1856861 RepID=UPI0007FD3203|nr:hypothetical protein [Mycobacterium sp. 1164966.3]OBA83305.1 hypothetical protein A9W99_08250 [Mycobacterium sp. 1164966.3]
MDSERFRKLVGAPGPFASVHFDDSHDTHDAETQLELKWRGLREDLLRQGAKESIAEEIGRAVFELRPPIGRSGRAVVASAEAVLMNEHLIKPPSAPIVRVSELPYILPIVEDGFEYPDYLLVEVDHTGADLTSRIDGTFRSEIVDGGGYPVHKAAGAETAGYGDPQLRTEEAGRKNIRAVADRINEVIDRTAIELIFVVGEVRSRSDLIAALPERIAELVEVLQVAARNTGHDDELQHAIEAACLHRHLRTIGDAAERFSAEMGRDHGLAAEGLGAVCSALRQGAVETMIIGDGIDGLTVVADAGLTTVAPNADVLSEQGAAPDKILRADEALPIFAISIGASLVRTDERISPADGVAAVLRYAPTLH